METTQVHVTQNLSQVETVSCNKADLAVEKKSVRGRRVKSVAENEHSQDPAVSAPVRGRRGKKTEATAPPTVRQTRNRNAKSQESTFNQTEAVQAVEMSLVTEVTAEAVSDQTSVVNASQEENDSAPPVEAAVVKPVKGRKTKTPAEPPQPETNEVSDQHLVAGTQQLISTVGKPRRGRKAQPDTVEPKEVSEDTVVTVEPQQMQPVGRAKRGRNAKQEENDDKTSLIKTTKSEDPVKKIRRTRKAEQDHIEPNEDIQTVEIVVQQVAEPEQSTVAAKPRRGGRKTKQETESEIPVESSEVQEVPAVSSTDKPKRGIRGKRVMEDAQVPQKKPDHELEAEQKTAFELDPVIILNRIRGMKTEVSQTIPAKRARRGAALLEENNVESALSSVEPAKRGRRAAVKPTTDNTAVSTDQENPSEELGGAVEDDTKTSKRSVKWKADLEVFEIPKTPVKAGRGRKSKAGNQVEAESKNVSKDVNKTEEKALSDQTVEAQPVKRARRGAKVVDKVESSIKEDPMKGAEAETQPKTRRGRSAKK